MAPRTTTPPPSNMSRLSRNGNGRKRLSRAISDDDDEPSGPSSKRGRYAYDASGVLTPTGHVSRNMSVSPSTEGTFQPGSLIRVKLKNFVTYTAAEFILGPSLNMIIGPNGTGKSTLVCAICLGLGWSS